MDWNESSTTHNTLPNEDLIVENDKIQNNYGECEDGQAIPKYDHTWYDTTYLDENESNSGDDNDEYTEPTCNDSDLNVEIGYASFDDHNKAHPIDEPIEPHHFQEFCEPSEISP